MGRKSASFHIVLHNRANINRSRLQRILRDFYARQVLARIQESTLPPETQAEILAQLIAYHNNAGGTPRR